MPGSNSIAKTLSTGLRLSAAIAQNADRLTLPEAQKAEFDQALAEFQSVLIRRDNLKAEKQELSRRLLEADVRLKNASVDTKALIKGLMGSGSERLTEYEIKPRRQITVADRKSQKAASRERAKKKAAAAALTGPVAAAAAPAAPAAPAGTVVPATNAETQG